MKKNIERLKSRMKNTLKFEALNDREASFKIAMKEAPEMLRWYMWKTYVAYSRRSNSKQRRIEEEED